ncbi:sigma-70 family RNA polymerase sigma factor [Bosea sp. RAC05]|uniref:sigma-70 family RNA polymerase sigma factor n=1 Tax=Bosea sp. RAC05 TaxID=1842539 RepID=UPI00083E0F6E|nr:sigma-70 family RNA polymerase sigma factor [Bosea sp. RAC05]AOG03449.1 RNA polymerase sigma factor, sigma-70 family protein [Bosea sp. RAC05]
MARTTPFISTATRQLMPANTAHLSRDQEADLVTRWQQQGDRAALDTITQAFQPFLHKLARPFVRGGMSIDDLMQAANVGFMQGLAGFKLETGFRLSTFAQWWVRSAIQEHVALMQTATKITNGRNQRRILFGIGRAVTKIERRGGTVSDASLADVLQVNEAEIASVRRAMAVATSLDTPLASDDDEASTLGSLLANDDEPLDLRYEREQLRCIRQRGIDAAVETLDPRSREIFKARRLRDDPETLEELSQRFDVSRERIRQIEVKAFEKVARHMRENDPLAMQAQAA